MAVLTDPTRTRADAAPPQLDRPEIGAVLTRVMASLVAAVLVPAVLLWSMLRVANFPTAVVVVLAWMVAVMSWRWMTGRAASGLLMLSLAILTIRTVVSLATGSSFLYFVQPVFTDLTVAVAFLGSLLSARPIVARLAPDFFPMNATVSARPEVCRLFRRLTLMWGLVIVLKAGITMSLLASLSTMHFVLIKGAAVAALTLTAVVATVVWAVVVGRQAGLLAPRRV
ncbi:MAG: hypothetical protein L0K86_04660 [Actinomycetia bacterium]|nr:hypothetical protein [Actinomycetes bacterium]